MLQVAEIISVFSRKAVALSAFIQVLYNEVVLQVMIQSISFYLSIFLLGVSISKFLLPSWLPPKKGPQGQKKVCQTLMTPKETKRPKGCQKELKEVKYPYKLIQIFSKNILFQCLLVIWYLSVGRKFYESFFYPCSHAASIWPKTAMVAKILR